MAKSRSTPTPTRPFVSYLGGYLGSGNGHGSPPIETDAERIVRKGEPVPVTESRISPPPCPRCTKTDVDEQRPAAEATYRWFRCYGCGNVWYEPGRKSR